MSVATIEVDGPGGRYRLAATGTGLLVVCLPGASAERFRAEVDLRLTMPPAVAGPELQDAGQLLAGLGFIVRHWDLDSATHVHAFPPPLDLRGPAFQRRVWSTLLKVPPGETVTYGRLAELAGSPGAARAVGTAMRSNPIPLFVPCHRVVASNGPGGYGAGLELKQRLLDIEAGVQAAPGA